MALNDNVKQSATAATSRSSGDHSLPEPPNSVGGPDTNVGSPSAVKSTSCSGVAEALTEYWCAMRVFALLGFAEACYDLIDQVEFLRFFGGHEVITICVGFDFFKCFTCVFYLKEIQPFFDPAKFLSIDLSKFFCWELFIFV